MLSLAENITIKKYEIPKITYTLKNDETNAYIEIGPSFETLLDFLNGRHTVGEVVKAYLPYDDNTSSQSSFDVFEHQTMVDGFKNMLLGLVLGKFIEIKKNKIEKNVRVKSSILDIFICQI